MNNEMSSWIEKLSLEPHPEGGYYREVYRSDEMIQRESLPGRFTGPRACATSIYFLLPRGEVSRLHRLKSDELWYFFTGADIRVHMISEEGEYDSFVLGTSEGGVFQAVVPRGWWFGASVEGGGAYSLVGCAVAPGFAFEDFEMGDRETLLRRYPRHREIIITLTA
ncbi:MAG TPA: cupin domain-containing protein [Spirochaetota bacterium]|nr:cupin domain-containing protein [Spirochaetota bacterium]HQP48754.1 cupin domain-containing protein [Spirochaetota bacterium]